jgi:hypothetical protein
MRSGWLLAISTALASATVGANSDGPTPGPPDAATTTRFEQLADAWSADVENVGYRSDKHAYLDHPAYRELVAMGTSVLPLVVERYRRDEFWGWGFVLHGITGVSMTSDPEYFSPPVLRERWLTWWDRVKGRTQMSATQALLDSAHGRVLIAPARSKTLFEWPDWLKYESLPGTMISPAMELAARAAKEAAKLDAAATPRDAFEALGMGLLRADENTVEWPLDDGSRLVIRLGAGLDEPVRGLRRIRHPQR